MGGGESWRHLRPADEAPNCETQLSPYRRPHHSATRGSSERNLLFNPACGAPFRDAKRRSGTSSEETWPATVRRGLKIRRKTAFPVCDEKMYLCAVKQ